MTRSLIVTRNTNVFPIIGVDENFEKIEKNYNKTNKNFGTHTHSLEYIYVYAIIGGNPEYKDT